MTSFPVPTLFSESRWYSGFSQRVFSLSIIHHSLAECRNVTHFQGISSDIFRILKPPEENSGRTALQGAEQYRNTCMALICSGKWQQMCSCSFSGQSHPKNIKTHLSTASITFQLRPRLQCLFPCVHAQSIYRLMCAHQFGPWCDRSQILCKRKRLVQLFTTKYFKNIRESHEYKKINVLKTVKTTGWTSFPA